MPTSESWYERHPKTTMAAVYLLILIAAELLVRAAAAGGYIRIVYFPTSDITTRYFGDNNPHFGVWHYPNRETRHHAPCYDVVYRSNSYGARDVERSQKAPGERRVVALGDSFVEGIGVNAEDRMTNISEALTGIQMLNFGVSGDVSSTQQWLIYRELASKFDHSEVFVFHLPANDFRDNHPENFSPRRYRPYLRQGANGELELFYTVSFDEREMPPGFSFLTTVRRRLYNSIYLLNLVRRSSQLFNEASAAVFSPDDDELRGTYDDYTELDLQRLLFGYRNIIELAQGRPVTIFVIPRQADFQKLGRVGYDFPLIDALQEFAKPYPNVAVVDLLPRLSDYAARHGLDPDDLYLACDGHWTPEGNLAAAEAVAEILRRTPAN